MLGYTPQSTPPIPSIVGSADKTVPPAQSAGVREKDQQSRGPRPDCWCCKARDNTWTGIELAQEHRRDVDVPRRNPQETLVGLRWLPLLLIAGYLIFAHGCHLGDHDHDDELEAKDDEQTSRMR
jgi:hypothetical protein